MLSLVHPYVTSSLTAPLHSTLAHYRSILSYRTLWITFQVSDFCIYRLLQPNVSRTWFPELRFSLFFPSVCFVHIHFLHFLHCLNEIREGTVLWPVPSIHPSVHLSSIDRHSQGRAPKLTVCPLFLDTATQSSVRPLKAFLSAFPELKLNFRLSSFFPFSFFHLQI